MPNASPPRSNCIATIETKRPPTEAALLVFSAFSHRRTGILLHVLGPVLVTLADIIDTSLSPFGFHFRKVRAGLCFGHRRRSVIALQQPRRTYDEPEGNKNPSAAGVCHDSPQSKLGPRRIQRGHLHESVFEIADLLASAPWNFAWVPAEILVLLKIIFIGPVPDARARPGRAFIVRVFCYPKRYPKSDLGASTASQKIEIIFCINRLVGAP
jgi:hypothetical protein